MSCHTYSEYMMKYFDKQANDIETAQLHKHLKTCGKCREEFRNLSEILSCIEDNNGIEPPENFEEQVMARIMQAKEQKIVRGEKLLIFLYGLTTMILLIVVAGIISGLKDISIIKFMNEIYNTEINDVNVFITEAFYNTSYQFYSFARASLHLLYEFTAMVMRSYSYVFGFSLAVLLMLQKLYFNLLGQASGRETE